MFCRHLSSCNFWASSNYLRINCRPTIANIILVAWPTAWFWLGILRWTLREPSSEYRGNYNEIITVSDTVCETDRSRIRAASKLDYESFFFCLPRFLDFFLIGYNLFNLDPDSSCLIISKFYRISIRDVIRILTNLQWSDRI